MNPPGPERTPFELPKPNQHRPAALAGGLGKGALILALVVGLQLGTLPWRFRREIWQLQGFLAGGLVGFVLGRLTSPRQNGSHRS